MSEENNTPETPEVPAEGAAAAKDELFEIKVDRKTVKVTQDELIRRAQLGSARERWEGEISESREQLQSDRAGYEGYKQIEGWMRSNPEGAQRMRAIYEGRNVPNVQPESDFNRDSNPSLGAPTAEHQQVLEQLNQTQVRMSQLEASLSARAAKSELDAQKSQKLTALQSQPSLKDNPKAMEIAELFVDRELSRNPHADVHDVAAEAAATVQETFTALASQTVQDRLGDQDFSTLSPNSGGPAVLPPNVGKVEPGTGREELRRGKTKAAAKKFLASAFQGAVNPPGKR